MNATLATTTDCSLASNAKVQWAWTNLAAAGLDASANVSVIVFAVTEDWFFGFHSTTAVAGADPLYIIVGSSTIYNSKAWGLLAWMLYS